MLDAKRILVRIIRPVAEGIIECLRAEFGDKIENYLGSFSNIREGGGGPGIKPSEQTLKGVESGRYRFDVP